MADLNEQEGESYLDQLLNSVVDTSATDDEALEQSQPALADENSQDSIPDQEEENVWDITEEEPAVAQEPKEDKPVVAQETKEEPAVSREKEEDKKSASHEEEEGFGEGEDISELLDLLSDHYDEEEEKKESMVESAMGIDDVFHDALSAVSYMGSEDEANDEAQSVLDVVTDGEKTSEPDDDDFLTPFANEALEPERKNEELSESESKMDAEEDDPIVALDEMSEEPSVEQNEDVEAQDVPMIDETAIPDNLMDEGKEKNHIQKEKPMRKSFRERFFDNIVDENTAKEEKANHLGEEEEEEKARLDKQAKKEQAAKDKEDRAVKKQEERERKKVEAEAKKTEKAKKKEERRQQQIEAEKHEVVGRINPVGAAIVVAFFVFIGIIAIFGTQFVSHKNYVKDAEVYMDTGNYVKAYKAMNGLKLSTSDQKLYNKVRILAALDTQLKNCDNFLELGCNLQALDSLLKGIKEYDENQKVIKQLDISSKATGIQEKISQRLQQEFQMTTAEARQILKTETREQYTKRLQDKVINKQA